MRVLVTGSKGMLGQELLRTLAQQHEVAGIDIEDADIRQADAIIPLVLENNPQAVIHTAAMTNLDYCEQHADETYAVNTYGTKHIALACQRLDCALLYVSTDYVFGGDQQRPYQEWDLPHPLSIYARSKYMGEEYAKALVRKFYVVRTAGLFGNQGKSFVKTILERAREKKGLKVINDQISNRTYAPHLAAALGALLSTHSYGMYHVANHGACSWYEFAVEILKLAGLLATTEIVPIKSAEYESKVVRPAYSALDMLAYEQAAGRTMRHYREALREYLNS